MTHIVAIFKLAQILPKMLPADMDMSSINTALQLRPKAFQRVDAAARFGRILAAPMVYPDVAITRLVDVLVAAHFIGADGRAGDNRFKNEAVHGGLVATGDNPRNQFPAAFQHPDHNRLVAHVAVAHPAYRPAHNRFVNLDSLADTAKRIVAVLRRHKLADFMAHAPSRLVGHAKLAFDFLGGNSVTRGAEQEHDVEPVAKRSAGPVERRIGGREYLMAAEIAGIRPAFCDRMELGFASAFFAFMREAVARLHKMLQTGFFGREAFLKLAESGGFRFHSHYIAHKSPWRKGIIADQVGGDKVMDVKSGLSTQTQTPANKAK